METLVLIPCTDRKRVLPETRLRAGDLKPGSVEELALEWTRRVDAAPPVGTISEVYCGRAYQEAATAAKRLRCEIAVISAGLGIVRSEQEIPSYSLTVTPGNDDTILKKIKSPQPTPQSWWAELRKNRSDGLGLEDLLKETEASLVLLSLSASYAVLVKDELAQLNEEYAKRLRIFGSGIAEHLPPHLVGSVMPYDVRLNGLDSPIRGTMSDFGSRALHHFAQCLEIGDLDGRSPEKDYEFLTNLMNNWSTPEIPRRERMTDDEVVGFILSNWDETGGRSGVSLRLLRDSGNACEQSRFRDLFKQALTLRQNLREGTA